MLTARRLKAFIRLMASRGEGGLIISFTNLTSAEMANQVVRKLHVALYPQK
jgi:GntR family transcriptional regulator/MocR family aminotransferase